MVLICEFMNKTGFLQNNLKKHALPRNVDTYGYMDKKRFFQNDHISFSRNIHLFYDFDLRIYGQKTISEK